MLEHRKIVELWQRGDAVALATLIHVEGSSYRRTGAKLLIAANGDYVGSISGGCLEAEVVRKAQWLTRAGAVVEHYSTLFDDTADIPYGLGCGGTVNLLIEPVATPEFNALMQAMQSSLKGERQRTLTQIPNKDQPLLRYILNANGQDVFRSKSALVNPNKPYFDEWLEPPQGLLIFGAGDDARPMVQIASLLGWNATVVDARSQWATAARFPTANRVVASSSLDSIEVKENDSVVVMTHSYEQDRAWLTALLPKAPRYLGLLGARHRSALLVSEAAVLLGWTMERACEGLFAPVGLDLGGDGAEAIALATVAEIQACCEGKLGLSQRMTPKIIAEQVENGGASRYLQAQCSL
jgi:xanthine dehydrogenase accessory factor